MEENDSILESIRNNCDLAIDDDSFDNDLLMYINTALGIVHQASEGVEPIFVSDSSTKWIDALTEDSKNDDSYKTLINLIRTYTQNYVKMIFDPPTPSAMSGLVEVNKELIYRIEHHNRYINNSKEEKHGQR